MQLNEVKEKTKTILDITNNNEVEALCNVIIKLVDLLEIKEKELGFKK